MEIMPGTAVHSVARTASRDGRSGRLLKRIQCKDYCELVVLFGPVFVCRQQGSAEHLDLHRQHHALIRRPHLPRLAPCAS